MSFAPKRIYLNDPLGIFEDESLGYMGHDGIRWSEDRISKGDYEYISSDCGSLKLAERCLCYQKIINDIEDYLEYRFKNDDKDKIKQTIMGYMLK